MGDIVYFIYPGYTLSAVWFGFFCIIQSCITIYCNCRFLNNNQLLTVTQVLYENIDQILPNKLYGPLT